MYPCPEADLVFGAEIQKTHIIVLKSGNSDQEFNDHLNDIIRNHNRVNRGVGDDLCGLSSQFSCGTFKAYCGQFHPETIRYIREKSEVLLVERNQITEVDCIVSQPNVPSWGLARISQRVPDNLVDYFYEKSAAEGVTGYVIDSGIRLSHEEFEGRATWGYNAYDKSDDDNHGHGTHVAGTLGGITYGVAKKIELVAVKVVGTTGRGTTETALKGIDWAFADASTKGATKCIANMSVGTGKSDAINLAVAAAVEGGLTFVVSAGNKGIDAATQSPASAAEAITVGAVGRNDARASFSNYGECVDVFAPGIDITSSWNTADIDEQTICGTSMAAPHVAGIAAFLISRGITDIPMAIKKLSGNNVGNPGPETVDLLVYNGSGR